MKTFFLKNKYKLLIISFLLVFVLFLFLFLKKKPVSIKQNQIKSVNNYNYQIENLKTEKKDFTDKQLLKRLSKLFNLYYNGVSDVYDLQGNKIKGVEPDPEKAINILYELVKIDPEKKNLYMLNLAGIYQFGMHKLKPNFNKAKNIYSNIIQTEKSDFIISEAQSNLNRILDEEHWDKVYTWLNLKNPKKGNNNKNVFNNFNNNNNNNNNNNFIVTNRLTNPQPAPVRNIIRTEHGFNIVDENDNFIRREGRQNTHNSQVLSTIKSSLEKLKTKTNKIKNNETCENEIRQCINKYLSNDKRRDAHKSLERILSNDRPLMFSEMKEIEALNLVWNRIHDDINKENTENLKENLMNELVEMQENGHTVCSTGRFTRIVDTLNAVDPDIKIMSTNMINQEILNGAGKIREQFLEAISEEEKQKFNLGTHPEQEKLENQIKENIKNKAYEDYVNTDIISKEKLDKEMNTWINEI